ncbi:hypothetical protein JOF29_004874 [Kribbella aluminosa]|uniref:SnoaL-like domain-containing protein n=1 Tax=Kribbella aluminosa TaxID=416017 RepID=A0ABS4UQ53_9ACTN|nr:nuclear transport factor 2 family protein [Kribbella aluminosa]MBP2353764.1 hypothetical protein [Kribbella aluminosa]
MTDLRELIDRSELAELVARHSLWIDELRYDESEQLFTDDIAVTSLRGEATGVEALVQLARKGHDTYVGTLHNKSNLMIAIDGDTATVRANDIAVLVRHDMTEEIAAAIHYYRARRTSEGWRFDRLEIVPQSLTAPLERAI